MGKQDVMKVLKRVRYLRILTRINRISAAVRRISMILSFVLLAINVIGVVKTIPGR